MTCICSKGVRLSAGEEAKKLFLLLIVVFFIPAVGATQEHSDPEGLYSHQIGHLFFMFAMVVLIVQIRRTSPLSKSWKYIGAAAFLFLLWNIDTFTVHWIGEQLDPSLSSGSAQTWTQTIDISSLKAKVFYAGKILDHFLSVGAMLAFLMGVRAFRGDVGEET